MFDQLLAALPRRRVFLAFLVGILQLLCLPVHAAPQASPSAPRKLPKFSSEVISAAKSKLGGNWSHIDLQQRNGEGPLANTVELSPGQYRVTLYPESFLASFPGFIEGLADVTDVYATGVLCGTLHHEQQHACLGVPGLQVGSLECRARVMSCEHLAIDFTTHAKLCTLAQQERAGTQATPPTGSWDTLVGLCDAAKALEQRWNTEKGARRAQECCKPESNPDCRFVPNAACPETDIPRPPRV